MDYQSFIGQFKSTPMLCLTINISKRKKDFNTFGKLKLIQ